MAILKTPLGARTPPRKAGGVGPMAGGFQQFLPQPSVVCSYPSLACRCVSGPSYLSPGSALFVL